MRPVEALAQLPYHVIRPIDPGSPLVLSSPHSGSVYPRAFIESSRLDFATLRRSEDCFVDQLFADAPDHHVPLLAADFPRVYCDANREPWELDPAMFAEKLPAWCNTRTTRVLAGFGTIARLVSSGEPIYAMPLSFAEAEARVHGCWHPYHAALAELIRETFDRFRCCTLLDCHSMPGERGDPRAAGLDSDFVLGDAYGTSCAPILIQTAHRFLEAAGFRVRRNDPYAGGYVTRHYGRPRQGIHTLQIEISRALYLEQKSYQKLPGFDRIRKLMSELVRVLADTSRTLIP